MATDYHQVLLKPFQKCIIRATSYEQFQAIRPVSQYAYKTYIVYVSDSRAGSYFFNYTKKSLETQMCVFH